MHKPNFGVVTAVVTVLVIIAFGSRMVVDLIPPGPENRLASESAEFMLQASHEQIDWRPLDEDTFRDARKQDKPIMLVVGSACSPTGRAEDRLVFPAKEVRGFLARNFICARVDTMERPEFQNAFLPISRALLLPAGRLGIPPDYQLWFLDPRGYLFGYAAEAIQGQPLDSRALLSRLEDAANRFEKLQEQGLLTKPYPDPTKPAVDRYEMLTAAQESSRLELPGFVQLADVASIETDFGPDQPDLSKFVDYLKSSSPPQVGGFPVNRFQRLWPSAWQFQLYAGRYNDYAQSLNPCLTSPLVDLLDGGFFTDSSTLDWRGIDYDKLAVTNAAMAETLAAGSVLTGDATQKWLAGRTIDALLDDFVDQGLFAAGQIGDSGALGRSDRCSFSPQRLRTLFPDDSDREWIRANLGMRVETNPQMTPMLVNLTENWAQSDRFAKTLDRLRKDRSPPSFAGKGQLDVNGFASARLMHSARVLGDGPRLLRSEAIFERLDDFRSLNDVAHSAMPDSRGHAYLGDYLAYADSALQYFLATGDASAFQHGVAVLRRGLFLFAGSIPGEYCLSQPASTPLAPRDASVPEIVDNVRESCSAQVMRLCNDYGRLLGPKGQDLQRAAIDTQSKFKPFAGRLGQFAGGYFCASVRLRDAYAVYVGPGALGQASLLAQRTPLNLVAPAVGPVSLPGTKPGFYVIAPKGIHGPLSIDAAAGELRKARTNFLGPTDLLPAR